MQWRSHKEVCTFIQEAQQFCHVVEQVAQGSEHLIEEVLQTLLALCSAGLMLSHINIEVSDQEEARTNVGRDRQEQYLFRQLSTVLGDKKYYSHVDFKAWHTQDQQKTRIGDLADDLADIYQDIAPGLQQWKSEADAYLGDIIWHWQFSFASHWREHAVDAIGYVHSLIFSE